MAKARHGKRDFLSRAPVREEYEVILIVCEGTNTEPDYFNGLRDHLRLSSVNVSVATPGTGSDPLSVVSYAESRMLDGSVYDTIHCVFDRDTHANFQQALQKIQDSSWGKERRLVAHVSVPCFELWLLLHFEYSSAPFTSSGGNSACDRVARILRRHIPGYDKNLGNAMGKLTAGLVDAIRHAKRLQAENKATGSKNPMTSVHALVDKLQKLKK